MSVLILALLMFLQNHSVNGSAIDFFLETFNDIAKYVEKTFRVIKNEVENLFIQQYLEEYSQHQSFTKIPPEILKIQNVLNVTNNRRLIKSVMNQDNYHEAKVNPTFIVATSQIAYWQGKRMQSYLVKTKDGFFLTVHRIISNFTRMRNRTVLLHHGILGSSTDWILLGPERSLPYILFEAGYDVWITNARGNYYSRGHSSMQIDSQNYWKFSWQEMGELDLPAVIDYIRQTKNTTEGIDFIGHSMGATVLLVLLSTNPQYNNYLRVGVLLAPLVYFKYVKGPMKLLKYVPEDIFNIIKDCEFLPSRQVPSWIYSNYCREQVMLCSNPLLFMSGYHEDQRRNDSFNGKLQYHVPAGGSGNTILHYMQLARNGKFHKYYSPNSEFNLKNVIIPIALISSSKDWLSSVRDVFDLFYIIPNAIDHHIVNEKKITHTDFVWGLDANLLVFPKVLEYLDKGLDWHKNNEFKS